MTHFAYSVPPRRRFSCFWSFTLEATPADYFNPGLGPATPRRAAETQGTHASPRRAKGLSFVAGLSGR